MSVIPQKKEDDTGKPCDPICECPKYSTFLKDCTISIKPCTQNGDISPCSLQAKDASKEQRTNQAFPESKNIYTTSTAERFSEPQNINKMRPVEHFPGQRNIPKANLRSIVPPPLKTEHAQTSPVDERKEKLKERRREEFEEKGILMALQGTIEHKVKCATMSTDHLLGQKRTKLRELLLAEDVAYTAEYVAKCQKAAVMREELLKSRAFELQKKLQREQQEYVDQKLLEHKVETCDAARLVLAQRNLKDIKKDQLWQIKEKYVLNEAKREEDRMYHDLMIKNMIAVKEKEEEEAKLVWFKQKEAQVAFEEQLKLKKQKAEEEKKLKELERQQLEEEIRLIKEENEKETGEKYKKNERIKADFREAMERERQVKEKRKREEEEIDRAFAELLKIESEKEKRKEISNKERYKREMDIFLEKSKELKQQREEDERKFDEMIKELEEKKRMQKDAERKKVKAAKEELFCNVLKEREKQIQEKRIKEKKEEEQRQAEIELLTLQIEQQRKIREEYERRCALQREEYKCQLLQQMKEVEEAKKLKKLQEEEYNRKIKEQQEREVEEVKHLLKNLPNADKPHPMKVFVREQPPRYVCPFPHPL